MRLGVTGHQRLADDTAWTWVRDEITRLVDAMPRPLVGLSSLAIGADQVFAGIILEHGGSLEAIVPFADYRGRFSADHRARYDALLARAARVEILRALGTDQEAYRDAGMWIVDSSDAMVAVWDGRPPVDVGGTADIVEYAQSVARPLTILNPLDRRVMMSPPGGGR